MTNPRERRSLDERREQLLEAAIAVMAREGVAASTTRAITAQAGLPHGAFHYCFDSKSQLFAEVLERELQSNIAAAFRLPPSPVEPRERLLAGLEARLDRVRKDPDRALALAELIAVSRRDPDLAHLALAEHTRSMDAVTDSVAEWLERESLGGSVAPRHLASVLIAVSDGVTAAWLNDRDDATSVSSLTLAATAIAAMIGGDAS